MKNFSHGVDENRSNLDIVFIEALHKPWEDFVSEENKRTEESAKSRLSKRREKLRQWQAEETYAEEFLRKYEVSTNHWRSNVHSQERVKLQRTIQDHQENVNHLLTVFMGIERITKQPAGIDPSTDDPKWQLDETEAVNRMRMRTIPRHRREQSCIPTQAKGSRAVAARETCDQYSGQPGCL